jgi:cyclase
MRLIARLDVKGPNLVKGIQLEGLRVLGLPHKFAQQYYADGIDEIMYVDIVASLYGRNNLREIVRETAHNIFVPITVAGGIRSIDDVKELLRCGADKVAINTAAVKRPELINEVAEKFGSQCMVLSIEAKYIAPNHWEVYTDNGRERTGIDVLEWAQHGVKLGAGEILVTSVDREGTRKGFDWQLVKTISENVSVPVIASGGMGTLDHLTQVIKQGKADAVAIADALHYKRFTLDELRSAMTEEMVLDRNEV